MPKGSIRTSTADVAITVPSDGRTLVRVTCVPGAIVRTQSPETGVAGFADVGTSPTKRPVLGPLSVRLSVSESPDGTLI